MGCLKLQEKFGSKLRVVYCSATNASGKLVEQRRFDAWEGGALKNHPVDDFSERASIERWREEVRHYNPTTLFNDLRAKNLAVITAETPLSNARIARNEVLYKPSTGMVDISVDIKTYIVSVYGKTSPQYKAISKLEVKNQN
jgi:hypothetical protein